MRFKRALILIGVAFMIGISNIILEEDRMVHDTKDKIEYVQDKNEDGTP